MKHNPDADYSLLPRHKIAFVHWQKDGGGDHERFRRLFREVWDSLPLWARRRILRHWRTGSLEPVVDYHMGNSSIFDHLEVGRFLFAITALAGYHLVFPPDTFEVMPDTVARTLIAHELAHVYFFAVEGAEHAKQFPNWEDDRKDAHWHDLCAHTEVYELMFHDWGFDEDQVDKWALDNESLIDGIKKQRMEFTEGK